MRSIIVAVITLVVVGCESSPPPERGPPPSSDLPPTTDQPSDPPSPTPPVAPTATLDAPTPEASALFAYLIEQTHAPGVLFGQQHATYTGHAGVFPEVDSDVRQALTARAIATAAHPAVVGFNFQAYRDLTTSERAGYLQRIIATDAVGAIITIHWPMANFTITCGKRPCGSDDNPGDVNIVGMIVDNTPITDPRDGVTRGARDAFDLHVDDLASFLGELRRADGTPIPVIFRPFHEMNNPVPGDNAHWWNGRAPAEYVYLYQHTVDRLRGDHGLANLLFAFAPYGFSLFRGAQPDPVQAYAEYWPESANPADASQRYVDVVGVDYYSVDGGNIDQFGSLVDTLSAFAADPERGVPRVAAIAECGRRRGTGSPTTDASANYQNGPFWMERLAPQMAGRWSKVAYMMTWSNVSDDGYFTTYPGAPEIVQDDFARWFELPETLFLDALPSLGVQVP